MANLKDIRDQIKSVKSIQKVTKAMKMVAAAKMRRAQENMEKARPYSARLTEMINDLISNVNRSILPLLEIRAVKRISYVVITSDKGLAGSFNSSILRKAHFEIDEFGKSDVDLFCIGKKGADYFKTRGYNVISSHTEFWNDLNFNDAVGIGDEIIGHFLNQQVDEIRVVYNEFGSVASQVVLSEKLLPLEFTFDENSQPFDRLYEPSKDQIIKSLVPRHLNIQMWKYLLESYASEQAARMVAMENATSNSEDMIKNLTLKFNKARQSAITTEMLEIVSGAEALKE